MINRATRRSMTIFGKTFTRYTFHVMDPRVGGGRYIRTLGSMLINRPTYILWPCR